jgi:hypothetical protein
MRAITVLAVSVMVAAGAAASGAKTTTGKKGKPTSGSAHVADTHVVNGKTHAAGEGIDKLLGPGAVTLVFSNMTSTPTPGVIEATAKPMRIWLLPGVLAGSGTVLVNTKTGALTDGHARFKGITGKLKGHTLVVTFQGTADLAAGRFFYTYQGVYK